MACGQFLGRRDLTALSCWAVLLLPIGCDRSAPPTEANAPAVDADRAYAHFAAGSYQDAAAEFERLVQANPTDFDARHHWAHAMAALGRFDDVDRILRTAPIRQSTRPATSPTAATDSQAGVMLWRRAYNIYRYYYHVTSPSPSGVFRVGAIRDAVEAMDLGDLSVSEVSRIKPMRLKDILELLALWVRWDRIARDVDLFPNRRWIPLLVVNESERLRDRIDELVELESRTAGAVWLHPADKGDWLAHPGAVVPGDLPEGPRQNSKNSPDELTETVGPTSNLMLAWTELIRWLRTNVPSSSITIVAAVRPEPDQPVDRRIALHCRVRKNHIDVERIATTGPLGAAMNGLGEFRRLSHAAYASVSSDVELDSLAKACSADGSDPAELRVDEDLYVWSDDRIQLACLLSYVRYGAALFDEPVVMTTAPSR